MGASGTLVIEAPEQLDAELLEELRGRDRRLLLAAEVDGDDKGALIVRAHNGVPFYEAKWRDLTGTQRKRRLGRAWVEKSGDEWVKRRGKKQPGYLAERRAYALMPKVIAAHEAELRTMTPALRQATFAETARAWLDYLETEKRVKPSTLSAYGSLLAEPAENRKARIMRGFGEHLLRSITTRDVRKFLSKLDREDISPRTVNIHRQVLHSIFEFASREETFGLAANPVAGTEKRPEDGSKPGETFEPAEVMSFADAARAGLHRGRGGYGHSDYSLATLEEWQRINDQDAALFTIAAFTGLRLGELLALRWCDVDLLGGVLIVSRAMSDGQETSTKSRRARTIPLAAQAVTAFKSLLTRERFTSRGDFVFCRSDGGPLDRSAVRKRFIRAQEAAKIRVRRFHDLRHTFGTLAVRRFDLVAVKEMMGHAKLSTTERYLHSKPRPTDAALLTAIFDEREEGRALALAA